MPQNFQILRCYSCETFNVDIVKKTNKKWQCKMCGENQSIKHVFGSSDSSKECREIVQQLNQKRGEKMDEIPATQEQYQEFTETYTESKITKVGNVSRWAKYMVEEAEENT